MSADSNYLSGTLGAAIKQAEIHQSDTLKRNIETARTPAEAEKAAKEFEALFIAQMLQHMFEGVQTDPLFGGGNAENIYRSMMMDEYGKTISETGRLGIADSVMKEILRLQEVQTDDQQ